MYQIHFADNNILFRQVRSKWYFK